MSEQLALPGMPLAERRAIWREHTSERWRRDDPDAVEECLHLIRLGHTNQTHLSRQFGVSTNTIHALMMESFSVEELQSITAKSAAILAMQATSKSTELVGDAKVKDLGAVSMTGKQAWDMAQVGSGSPTHISEERVVLTVEDFQELAETGSRGGKVSPMSGAAAARGGSPVVDAEVLGGLSDKSPLNPGAKTLYSQGVQAVCVLLFVQFLTLDTFSNQPLSGLLKRGGGGWGDGGPRAITISSGVQNFYQ
jgi:hypothetical protein